MVSNYVPENVQSRADNAIDKILPVKSRAKYDAAYDKFIAWQKVNKVSNLSETTFLAYFDELTETMAPNTFWSQYSMLRSQIQIKHGINLHDYKKIVAFLTTNLKGYIPKKANVLTSDEVLRFLKDAPDIEYLVVKVALIFGLQGACRRHELCDITTDNIKDRKDMVIVKVPVTKNDKPRTFVITDEFYEIFKKYANLRPKVVSTNRFFLNYKNGKCGKQVIGINTFGNMPKIAAKFLGLENPESYTGHSFRRTSTTLLADAGADKLDIKRHGGWKSDAVAEGYIEESVANKRKIGKMIANDILGSSQKKVAYESNVIQPSENVNVLAQQDKVSSVPTAKNITLQISNCNNLTVVLEDHKKL